MTTNSWIGGSGIESFGTQGSNANWSLGHTPTSTEDAFIGSGSGLLVSNSNETVSSIGIGSSWTLDINSASTFTATLGTGQSQTIFGTIVIANASIFEVDSSVANSGTIDVESTGGNTNFMLANNAFVILSGGGKVEFDGQSGHSNFLAGQPGSELINEDNDISGTGTIFGEVFTNQGIVETNNSWGAGTLQIWGNGAGGSFDNDGGSMFVDAGGTMILGIFTSTIGNEGTIQLAGASGEEATLEVNGNLTINQAGGQILLQGPSPSFDDRIVSNGSAATLNLDGGKLAGAGTVGDSNLTLNNQSLIDANEANQSLTLGTGSNTITNSAGATLEADGGILGIGSPVSNAGTIKAIDGGTIDLFSSVTGSGTIDLFTNSTLFLDDSVSGNITFKGSGVTLALFAPAGLHGEVIGAAVSDKIDWDTQTFSAANSLRWTQTATGSGVLALVSSSGATLASVTLTGSFIASDFSMSKDSFGGTLATIVASVPWSTPDDFNDDGISDALWRNSDGTLAQWFMNGSVVASTGSPTFQGSTVSPDSSWSVAGIGDFNGDGTADTLWRQSSSGTLVEWLMDGSTIATNASPTFQGSTVSPDSSWSVAGIGDFNGDGNADMLWRQSSTGTLVEWLMNGSTIVTNASPTFQGNTVSPDSTWSVAGVGDFNGDGNADLLWRQSSTGTLVEWLMNGSTIATSVNPTFQGSAVSPDSTWSVAGVGDFNGDGNADLFWRNSNGTLVVWLMNGSTIATSANPTFQGNTVSPDSTWNVIEVGDFNGSNQAGVLWRQSTTGSLVEWQMNGAQIASSNFVTFQGNQIAPANTWQPQAHPTDFA